MNIETEYRAILDGEQEFKDYTRAIMLTYEVLGKADELSFETSAITGQYYDPWDHQHIYPVGYMVWLDTPKEHISGLISTKKACIGAGI